LDLDLPEIEQIVKEMDEDSKALKKELFKMAWYMRGSLSIEEAFTLDIESRTAIAEIIQENLETTKETKLPFF
jgi:hypothetical protein